MKNLRKIETDPFFISERLREIDPSYFLVYDLDEERYEVHSSEQLGGSYCFAVRFNDLDERTLDYARRTRSEKQAEIIAQIDRENEKLRRDSMKNAAEKMAEVL